MKCQNCKMYKDCSTGSGLVWPCGAYRPVSISNADYIRSMTDEELAQMIIRSQKKDPSILWCRDEYGCADLDDSFDCTDELQVSCIARWLRQPKEAN